MSEVCPDDTLLAGYVDRTLPPGEQQQVEHHIDACASCRGLVAELLRADAPLEESDAGLLDTLSSPLKTGSVLLTQGERVGRFIVLDRLGLGGMGVVYAAHDPQLDRKVALKLLRADVAQGAPGEEARQRLLREAKALARLDHPNVIGVHDVGTFGDEIFVAVEFVDGETLRGWREQRPRSWREVLATYLQAGRGLAAAHAAGLVHRDFKPENALMGKDGRVRVTDFGLVRAAGNNLWPSLTPAPVPVGGNLPLEAALTRANAILGTPAYMAPEQLDGKGADERSDQFSFSVALFEALYGARPYPGKTLEEVRRAIRKGKPAFPVTSKVPFRVRRVLARALSPSPFDRYSSMDALLEGLVRARLFVARRTIALSVAAGTIVVSAGVVAWPSIGGQPPRQGRAPPVDVRTGSQLELLQERLAEVKAQRAAGNPARARELAAKLDEGMLVAGLTPLRAELLFQRGSLEWEGGDPVLAEQLLEDALMVAESVRDDVLAARTMLELTRLIGAQPGRQAEAARLARRVEGKLNRLGGAPELRSQLQTVLNELEEQ